jgi:hypothetical protein
MEVEQLEMPRLLEVAAAKVLVVGEADMLHMEQVVRTVLGSEAEEVGSRQARRCLSPERIGLEPELNLVHMAMRWERTGGWHSVLD